MRYAGLMVLFTLLAGCGGGGGGSMTGGVTTTPSPPVNNNPVTPPVANVQTRQIQPGDRLVYTFEAATRESVSGTVILTSTISSLPTVYGYTPFKQVTAMDFTYSGQSYFTTGANYVYQGIDGSTYMLGYELQDNTVVTMVSYTGTPIAFPSPITVGQNWSYQSTMSNGSHMDVTNTVLAMESVQGIITYKIERITRENNGGTFTNTRNYYWFAPSLGYPVKSEIVIVVGGNTNVYFTTILQSKNF